MSKTLLNAVNEVLKRVGVIAGDAGALTSLTDGSRQRAIDVAVQAINEANDALYTTSNMEKPTQQSSSTIVLVTDTRAYALANDLERLIFPLVDRTNTQFIYEYDAGYNGLLLLDPEQDDTGLPLYAAIRPADGYLFLDRAPTSAENGRTYTYQYDKNMGLSAFDDTVPFSDTVFRALVPCWVQIWKRELRNEFDSDIFNRELGIAASLLTKKQPRTSYNPRC